VLSRIGETRVDLDHRPIDCRDIGADVAGPMLPVFARIGQRGARRIGHASASRQVIAPVMLAKKELPLTLIYGLNDEAFDS
jgi:hypothetical protein